MGAIFSKPKVPKPPPVPKMTDPGVQAAATAERMRQSRLRGGASTILTKGNADEQVNIGTKTLKERLGG